MSYLGKICLAVFLSCVLLSPGSAQRVPATASAAGGIPSAQVSASRGKLPPTLYSFTTIDYPGANYTEADGINNAGQIVGVYNDSNGSHGFLKVGSTFTSIDYPGQTNSGVHGINSAGKMVGYYASGGGNTGFLYDGTNFSQIIYPGAYSTVPNAINDSDEIVGTYCDLVAGCHGFLYNGTYTTIQYPGGGSTSAMGINNVTLISGGYNLSGDEHGFLYDGVNYSSFDCAGSTYTLPRGMNNSLQIVGHWNNSTDNHGFLYQGGNCTNIDFPGVNVTYADAINDPGQIVGVYFGSYGHGFLATPVQIQSCVQPPNTTMVAWYSFDETQTGTSRNLATGNTGTWYPAANLPVPVPGMVGGALSFNGVNQYIESPSSLVTDFGPGKTAAECAAMNQGGYSACMGDFSVDTWVQVPPGASRDVMTVLDKRGASSFGIAPQGETVVGYHVFLYQGKIGLQLADGDFTNYASPTVSPDIYDGQWHHIAVTVHRTSADGIHWYHNGVCLNSCTGDNPTTHKASLVSSVPLRIGTRTADDPLTGWFQGSLDELEIFNRELTPDEISGIYNAGSAGKCKPQPVTPPSGDRR